jgi:Bax protein
MAEPRRARSAGRYRGYRTGVGLARQGAVYSSARQGSMIAAFGLIMVGAFNWAVLSGTGATWWSGQSDAVEALGGEWFNLSEIAPGSGGAASSPAGGTVGYEAITSDYVSPAGWLDGLTDEDVVLIPRVTPNDYRFLARPSANSTRPDIEFTLELGPHGEPHARLRSVEALALYLDEVDYDLDSVRNSSEMVPRRYVANLPPDLDAIESVNMRKQLFIKALLPVVLRVNEAIEAERARLTRIASQRYHIRPLATADEVWLTELYKRYGVKPGNIGELLVRVDVIPPSLALAQAAEESGWGTSRFAREGNALFGQYTSPEEPGLDPQSKASAGKFRIRSYDSLLDTVRSYALNLNLHPAYEEFRELRAELRASEELLDGNRLAGTLTRYSERGPAYVKAIRIIMRENSLRPFDEVRLHGQVLVSKDPQSDDSSS